MVDSCTSCSCFNKFRSLIHRTVQVLKPMWPFIAASSITFYLVSKAQDMGVRCAYAFCAIVAVR